MTGFDIMRLVSMILICGLLALPSSAYGFSVDGSAGKVPLAYAWVPIAQEVRLAGTEVPFNCLEGATGEAQQEFCRLNPTPGLEIVRYSDGTSDTRFILQPPAGGFMEECTGECRENVLIEPSLSNPAVGVWLIHPNPSDPPSAPDHSPSNLADCAVTLYCVTPTKGASPPSTNPYLYTRCDNRRDFTVEVCSVDFRREVITDAAESIEHCPQACPPDWVTWGNLRDYHHLPSDFSWYLPYSNGTYVPNMGPFCEEISGAGQVTTFIEWIRRPLCVGQSRGYFGGYVWFRQESPSSTITGG